MINPMESAGERIAVTPIEVMGDGLVLRQLTIGDASDYFAAIERSREHFAPYEQETPDKYRTEADVVSSIVDPSDPSKIRFGVWEDGSFVCTVDLTPYQHCAKIGYWRAADAGGRGVATRAVQAVTEYGIARFGMVYAEVKPGNDASKAVLLRAGYHSGISGLEGLDDEDRRIFSKGQARPARAA